MNKVGSRVGAILDTNRETKIARLFGYGVYRGDEIPPKGHGYLNVLHDAGVPNPKIELDNGSVVWGCQCWWGPEEQIKQQVEGFTVVEIKIEDLNEKEE